MADEELSERRPRGWRSRRVAAAAVAAGVVLAAAGTAIAVRDDDPDRVHTVASTATTRDAATTTTAADETTTTAGPEDAAPSTQGGGGVPASITPAEARRLGPGDVGGTLEMRFGDGGQPVFFRLTLTNTMAETLWVPQNPPVMLGVWMLRSGSDVHEQYHTAFAGPYTIDPGATLTFEDDRFTPLTGLPPGDYRAIVAIMWTADSFARWFTGYTPLPGFNEVTFTVPAPPTATTATTQPTAISTTVPATVAPATTTTVAP